METGSETAVMAENEALRAVRRRGLDLECLPAGCRTEAVCLAAVRQDGRALKFVPLQARTADVCLDAVQNWGWALEFVPEVLKTPELCLEAVRADAGAVCFVPRELRTKELCSEAMAASPVAAAFAPKAVLARLRQDAFFAERLAPLYASAESAEDAAVLAGELARMAIDACPPDRRQAAAAGMAEALGASLAEDDEENAGPRP